MLTKPNKFDYDQILSCSRGEMYGPGNAQLPMPPMLMFDRIIEINETGGKYGKGFIQAELDINPELWFFGCHFPGDPVMPGCLGLDAMWQLVGFFLGWQGHPGRGRALGSDKVRFSGEVTPDKQLVTYRIDMKKLITRRLIMGIADASMDVDGEIIYESSGLRVGLYE